jgi:uncharacterized protein (TIGR02284 family)
MTRNTRSRLLLHDLIEVCVDGEQGFERCAARVGRLPLRELQEGRARECRRAADELARVAGEPAAARHPVGGVSGAMRRGWVTVRRAVSGNDELAALQECERGEDDALHRYEEAMQTELPVPVRDVVASQYAGVRRNHDQVRAWRDSARAAQAVTSG